MKGFIKIFALLALVTIIAAPLVAQAAGKKAKSEVVMKMSNKVHLFHSGNVEAQKEIAIGDVLPVYRTSIKGTNSREVGAVKVLSFIGEHYFEAEIIKGEVKIGDIATKDSTSLLVQPAQ